MMGISSKSKTRLRHHRRSTTTTTTHHATVSSKNHHHTLQIVDEDLQIEFKNGVNFVTLKYECRGIVSMLIPTIEEDIVVKGSANVAGGRVVEFLKGIDHSKDSLLIKYLAVV